MYPTKLTKIINLFETLPEEERRETLVSYADNAKNQEPRENEDFDLVDVRKDEECTDTVGVYLHVDENGKAHIRMTLGPEVQTLTRSMTAILCKGLEASTPQEILDLPSDFVTRIVGTELVLIGSGPIIIGQGCEFDYSGVQACKALREERYQVVLVNSNPATIMTDPEFADHTYIEPITAEVIEAIMEREKPDAILPTLGGQTALNAAMELNRNGALS